MTRTPFSRICTSRMVVQAAWGLTITLVVLQLIALVPQNFTVLNVTITLLLIGLFLWGAYPILWYAISPEQLRRPIPQRAKIIAELYTIGWLVAMLYSVIEHGILLGPLGLLLILWAPGFFLVSQTDRKWKHERWCYTALCLYAAGLCLLSGIILVVLAIA